MLATLPAPDAGPPFEPPECACEGSGLVLAIGDSHTGDYRPGYRDDEGRLHGEPCPCALAREAHTCAHCGRVVAVLLNVAPGEAVCGACVGAL